MDELEQLRKQKMLRQMGQQQMQQMQPQLEEQAEARQQINALETFVKQHMSADAIARYGNIKTADEEKALQVLVVVGQLIKSGRTASISDAQLKQILMMITPKKKEFQIRKI